MANYDVERLHQRILRILMAVDGCCREHRLRYYIWAGTQLGAVRHKGFIPWDDDIDIAMPLQTTRRRRWWPTTINPILPIKPKSNEKCSG